jgi:hypothetical protein
MDESEEDDPFPATLTAQLLSFRTTTVEMHPKVSTDASQPKVDIRDIPTTQVKVDAAMGWFPYAPGRHDVDAEGSAFLSGTHVHSNLPGTVGIGVYATSIQSRTARLAFLHIKYRDGYERAYGKWPQHQLVRLITNEWSTNEDNTVENKQCFLVEITKSTSLERLLSLFRKRCQVGKFGTQAKTLTDIVDSKTSVLIQRSMKEMTLLHFDGKRDKPCTPPLETAPPDVDVVISAEALRALGPLEADSMQTDVPPCSEQVDSLRYLYAGLTNLLYRVQEDVICGDQLGEHRTICVRRASNQCEAVSFYQIIRHLQHSK